MATKASFAQDVTEEWAQIYNGQGPRNEYFQASAVDDAGNLYLTSTSFTTSAFRNGASREHGEILTVKFAPTGEVLWAHRFMADSTRNPFEYTEEARAIAVDGSGGVYVAGVRQTETGTVDENQAIVLFKLNASDGSLAWKTDYTDGKEAEVAGIAIDEAAGVFLTGTRKIASSYKDYLTLNYNSSTGALLWKAQHDGVGGRDDLAHAIAVDGKGGVIVTGKSFRESYSVGGRGPSYSLYDIATVKYGAESGEKRWVSNFTGDTVVNISPMIQTQKVSLALDEEGEVYVTGLLEGSSRGDQMVTVRYGNRNGNRIWASSYAAAFKSASSMALDSAGGVYVAVKRAGSQLSVRKYHAANGVQLWEADYTGATTTTLSVPELKVGHTGELYVTSFSSFFTTSGGVVTARYNSTTGTLVWDKFYQATLASTGFPLDNLAVPHIALLIDGDGNPYVMGSAYTTEAKSNSDLFVLRYGAADGATVWEKYYGATGSTHDFVTASAVDAAGNTYVTGISISEGGGNDIAILKYSTTGEEMWVRRYDGGTGDRSHAIALDAAGDVYVTGATGNQGATDYLTLKLQASDGAVVWESRYDSGTDDYDTANGIALDGMGGVYVTGMSYSSATSSASSDSDYATVKYDASDGKQVWVQRFDGGLNLNDEANAIAVDKAGGVYVTGGAAYDVDHYHGMDFATVKYQATDGEQLWVARFDGGVGYDAAIALAVDDNGGVYVTGRSTGEDDKEGFATVKYDVSDGNQLWASSYSSANRSSLVIDLVVDNTGGVYVTGYNALVSPEGVMEATYVTIRYAATDGEQVWVQTYGDGGSDARAYAIATDSVGGVYVTGQRVAGTGDDWSGSMATIKYNAEDGALQWEVLKEGTGEGGRSLGLDLQGNVYVAGISISVGTAGDFLTVKYSQNAGCIPVVAQAITGAATVRAGTQSPGYSLSGTGASSFYWTVTGDQSVSISGQGTEEIAVNWPAEAGMYEVGVTYSAGAVCPARDTTLTVAVFDPNAGFVVGAGWVHSPVNPALPFMQTGGKAHVAFASWYIKDARTVAGYTAFRFSSGGLTFTSAAHTPMRLVISGNRANYTGHGTVNGQEGYGFLVAAVDGGTGKARQQDRLRLKVWERATGRVVYDNQAGAGEGAVAATALDGGEIVIHRPLGRSLDQLAALAEGISQGAQPEQHNLQTYPSISSGLATVTFVLDQEEAYTLGLYNLNGTLVQMIGEGRAQAGRRYKHSLNANGMAEGLYFVRLVTGAEVQTVKMLLKR